MAMNQKYRFRILEINGSREVNDNQTEATTVVGNTGFDR